MQTEEQTREAMVRHIQPILSAAETASNGITTEAQDDADQHLHLTRERADEAAADRLERMTRLSDGLLEQAESLGREFESLAGQLGGSRETLREMTKAARQDTPAPLETPDAPGSQRTGGEEGLRSMYAGASKIRRSPRGDQQELEVDEQPADEVVAPDMAEEAATEVPEAEVAAETGDAETAGEAPDGEQSAGEIPDEPEVEDEPAARADDAPAADAEAVVEPDAQGEAVVEATADPADVAPVEEIHEADDAVVEAESGDEAAAEAETPEQAPDATAPDAGAAGELPWKARLLAMQMAVAGSSREEIEGRLRDEFEIADPSDVLDELLES
ncbi:MAG: hypothetical protein ACR2NA_09675 [Solirubrobacterales bacterium]